MNPPQIEFVTHCWAGHVKQYARLLSIQLEHLLLNINQMTTDTRVCMTVCFCVEDTATKNIIEGLNLERYQFFRPINISKKKLWRRSIGRNWAAMGTKADLVWFTDCDYLFGHECLDQLVPIWEKAGKPTICWPKTYQANADKSEVDDYISKPQTLYFNCQNPFVKENPRAIGGVQIVDGNYCRQYGYLNNSRKFQSPVDTPFPNFRDDIAFRETCLKNGTGAAIEIPGVFRMRHSEIGYGVK